MLKSNIFRGSSTVPACRQAGSRKIMFVYILKSVRYNRYYVGLTDDVKRRFKEHNNGWVSKTKFYRPFQLIHIELAENRNLARDLEKYFKSGYGREIFKEIEKSCAPV